VSTIVERRGQSRGGVQSRGPEGFTVRGLRALSRLQLLRPFSTFYPTPDKNKY